MSKFELSLCKDYVKEWSIFEAAREFLQNAIDQSNTEGNDWSYKYDPDTAKLAIMNKKSILKTSSLLLGSTSKSDDDDTIGHFGEGYKIATLVATREGHNVTFYNYGAKEVWRPRFVNSRRYGEQVLTFFVEKFMFKNPPDNNLTVVIDNITPSEMNLIRHNALPLQEDVGDAIETKYGTILMDEKHAGRIFVNGLFVKHDETFKYGYDIPPKYLKLDRDRRMIEQFELSWQTSTIWGDAKDELVLSVVDKDYSDAKYLAAQYASFQKVSESTKTKAYEDFRGTYGDKAIPVYTNEDLQEIKDNYYDAEAVMVSELHKALITNAPSYSVKATEKVSVSKEDRLRDWYDEYCSDLHQEACDEFVSILEM